LQAVLEESNVDRETEISNTMHLYEAAEQLSQSVALP
jgi:flagellar basal body rod protein FlgG